MKDSFERFVTENPRDPHPDTLSWETADLSNNPGSLARHR